jgi:hypothetical protein
MKPTLNLLVMPGLVPGIQLTASAGARGKMDSGDPGRFAGAGTRGNDTGTSV